MADERQIVALVDDRPERKQRRAVLVFIELDVPLAFEIRKGCNELLDQGIESLFGKAGDVVRESTDFLEEFRVIAHLTMSCDQVSQKAADAVPVGVDQRDLGSAGGGAEAAEVAWEEEAAVVAVVAKSFSVPPAKSASDVVPEVAALGLSLRAQPDRGRVVFGIGILFDVLRDRPEGFIGVADFIRFF